MAEEHEREQFIKCSNCKCKFHNDDEHIKIDFGYNRLGLKYKCCIKCRETRKRERLNKRSKSNDKE